MLFEVMVIYAWSRYFVELMSRFLSTLNIVPHFFWHVLPYRRVTKKYEDFPSMVILQLFLQKFWIQSWICNFQRYLCLIHIVFQYIPGGNDTDFPKSTSLLSTFHIELIFCFLPAHLMSSTYTDKNNPFFTVYKEAFPIGNLLPFALQ